MAVGMGASEQWLPPRDLLNPLAGGSQRCPAQPEVDSGCSWVRPMAGAENCTSVGLRAEGPGGRPGGWSMLSQSPKGDGLNRWELQADLSCRDRCYKNP